MGALRGATIAFVPHATGARIASSDVSKRLTIVQWLLTKNEADPNLISNFIPMFHQAWNYKLF
jgi:hypothetical protein